MYCSYWAYLFNCVYIDKYEVPVPSMSWSQTRLQTIQKHQNRETIENKSKDGKAEVWKWKLAFTQLRKIPPNYLNLISSALSLTSIRQVKSWSYRRQSKQEQSDRHVRWVKLQQASARGDWKWSETCLYTVSQSVSQSVGQKKLVTRWSAVCSIRLSHKIERPLFIAPYCGRNRVSIDFTGSCCRLLECGYSQRTTLHFTTV